MTYNHPTNTMSVASPSPSPSPYPSALSDPDPKSNNGPETFPFPPHHAYPPLYTLQPTLTTRTRQLQLWRDLLLSYCEHHRIYRLVLISAAQWPLFNNTQISKRVSLKDLNEILAWVVSKEGGERGEWIGGAAGKGDGLEMWVYWKRPEEWARVLEEWVDGTGQKATVLTVYELLEGEGSAGEGGLFLPFRYV
jgi:ESCRT-II complex subunit VPS25